jgi:hypothetical protein
MLTVRRPLTVALALAVGAPLVPAAAQNLVQNGGFETPALGGTTSAMTLSGCPAAFVWCIGQGNVDLVRTRWEPGEGSQSLDLNGTEPGLLYQDLATTPGREYDLSFLFSGHPEGDPQKTMHIVWNGMDLGEFKWIVGPGQDFANMFWSPLTIFGLLATSPTTRLEFRSTTTTPCGGADPSCGVALDGVSVTAVSSVPEPATLALVGGGVLALGAVARRRRVR